MCGITGIAGFRDDALLKKMSDVLIHRGPNAYGFYTSDNASLGHRRLSIIDLSEQGKQPLFNEDKTICVVHNGEIYNYREIKDDLVKKGHKFYCNSDSEVIAHLYEEYGLDFLNKMNGMWGLALWDSKNEVLILSRDRMGVKPIYYTLFDGKIAFASQLNAIFQIKSLKKEIESKGLIYYSIMGYCPSPYTCLKNFYKLPPASVLIYKNGNITVKKYWEVNVASDNHQDERYYSERIEELLNKSVERRLISDVPLGVFLSGGVDSSVILGVASQLSNEPVKAFSVGFEEESFNELPYAEKIANLFGAEHYKFILTYNDFKNIIENVMNYMDEPICDPSFLPVFMLSKETKKYVTVVLGGDGCDEQFGGYITHQNAKIVYNIQKIPKSLRNAFFKTLIKILPVSHNYMSFDYRLKGLYNGLGYPFEIANFIWLGVFNHYQCGKLLNLNITENDFQEMMDKLYSDYFTSHNTLSPLQKILFLDFKYYLPDSLLMKVDFMSMAHALEVRAPFLDYELVEFAATIPPNIKVKNQLTKYIIKKTYNKIIPENFLNRKKQGFSIPVAKWFYNKNFHDYLRDVIYCKKNETSEFLDYDYINKLIDEHINLKENNWRKLWNIFVFKLWYNKYISN